MKLPRFRLMLLLLVTALVAVVVAWQISAQRVRELDRAYRREATPIMERFHGTR